MNKKSLLNILIMKTIKEKNQLKLIRPHFTKTQREQ